MTTFPQVRCSLLRFVDGYDKPTHNHTKIAVPLLTSSTAEIWCLTGDEAMFQRLRHGGFLRPSPKGVAGRAHLQHTDGTPFWWLADTLWTAPSSRKW